MMGHAFQFSYEDILRVLSSVFFGKGKSRKECNKILPKRLTGIGFPLPPSGLLPGENNLQSLISEYWILFQTRERLRCLQWLSFKNRLIHKFEII